MNTLFLILLYASSPLIKVEQLSVVLFTQKTQIFKNYKNNNFEQIIYKDNDFIGVKTFNKSFDDLNLNHRIIKNNALIVKIYAPLKEEISLLWSDRLDEYLINIFNFFKSEIKYDKNSNNISPKEVYINKSANCIGMSKLMIYFLKAANIKCKEVKGFFLQERKKKKFIPTPHRWVEIELSDHRKFFFDPQTGYFSANYILLPQNIDFTLLKKFYLKIIKRENKIKI